MYLMPPHYLRGGRAALAPQKGKGGSERARDESVAVFILDLVSPDLAPGEMDAHFFFIILFFFFSFSC